MPTELKKSNRTEEVQEIIDRMPTGFGYKITVFVLFLVIAFYSLGWIINYPDVVTGKIVINASKAPVKLVCNNAGKLKLYKCKNYDFVKEGTYIGVVQNAAETDDVQLVAQMIAQYNKTHDKLILSSFPKKASLGDMNASYFKLLNAVTQSANYYAANVFDKQIELYEILIEENRELINIATKNLNNSSKSLGIIGKFRKRDSLLHAQQVLSESDNDRSELTLITAKSENQNILRDVFSTRNQLQQVENQLQQIKLQKIEKEKQLELDLITAVSELDGNIKTWEQKYVFKAPIDGKLQFLNFWGENQFIEMGEPIFKIVPLKTNIIGQMTLPAAGAGKVLTGQEVIIKLDDYPYSEYGSIKGKVSTISLITNPVNTKDGPVELYLATVDLPNKLITNYGKQLTFKFEIKGSGDIITHKRRLLERLFDNLKYSVK